MLKYKAMPCVGFNYGSQSNENNNVTNIYIQCNTLLNWTIMF